MKRSELKQIIREVIEESNNNQEKIIKESKTDRSTKLKADIKKTEDMISKLEWSLERAERDNTFSKSSSKVDGFKKQLEAKEEKLQDLKDELAEITKEESKRSSRRLVKESFGDVEELDQETGEEYGYDAISKGLKHLPDFPEPTPIAIYTTDGEEDDLLVVGRHMDYGREVVKGPEFTILYNTRTGNAEQVTRAYRDKLIWTNPI